MDPVDLPGIERGAYTIGSRWDSRVRRKRKRKRKEVRPMKQGEKAKVVNTSIEDVPVSELRQHPENPRQGDVGAISQSIGEHGFYGTVVAQRSTGFILAGNHRWEAAMAMGMTEVPTCWVDCDDATALRILLADNRLSDLANYDAGHLAELLTGLAMEGQLEGTGYDGDAVDDLLREIGTLAAEVNAGFGEIEGEVWTDRVFIQGHDSRLVLRVAFPDNEVFEAAQRSFSAARACLGNVDLVDALIAGAKMVVENCNDLEPAADKA